MKRLLLLVPILMGLAACTTPGDTPTPTPTAATVTATPTAQPPAATAAVTPVPTAAPSPTTLLSLKGDGIKNSAPFTASGDSITVAYTFDCKSFGYKGNFMADLMDSTGSPNSIANALAMNGADSTTVYLSDTTSPYHVEVNSECSWTVIVTGTP